MTLAARQLLDTFETLPEADKRQVAVEILRRCSPKESSDIPELELVGAAEELFDKLDRDERSHADNAFAIVEKDDGYVTAETNWSGISIGAPALGERQIAEQA